MQLVATWKCFVIDFKLPDGSVDTKLFDYDSGQHEAEEFCRQIKLQGGAVNIKIRDVEGRK